MDDFDFITCNFPPNPWPVNETDGKVSCDLTFYDAPTLFAKDILSHQNLQVLKVFTDNLSTIPDGIGNLKNLEELVLCHFESHTHSNLTQLPVTLKNLRKLKLLDVRRNPLLKFPSQLTMLVNLEELHINDCKLSSLPDQLEKLQMLKVLDLSNNYFESLPLCVTKLQNLVRLYASDGKLRTLCKEIKNLAKLEGLQLKSNQLTSLPDELFDLVNLRKLHLNVNQLTSLNDKVGQLVNLEYLVLNGNKLTRLPDTMGALKKLCYLNLHENLLTRLPESMTNLTKMKTLLVENNPLQVPPVYVCNQGIPSMKAYFQAMNNTGKIHSKRLKVVLLGESMAGKTSLVNALVKGEACEIYEHDRTFGVVFYHWKPEPDVDELELLVVDCAGQRKYHMTHQFFLSEGALLLLTVDLSSYEFDNSEAYHNTVGEWITLVAARIPRARILIVPTHVDGCAGGEEEIKLKCDDILTKVMEDREEMLEEIDKRFKTECSRIPEDDRKKLFTENEMKKANLPVISLKYQGKSFDKTQHSELDISMNVLPVSNIGSLQGMIGLRKELVRIARNKDLSSTVDRALPELWVKVESTIKEAAKDMPIPCMSETELLMFLSEKNVNVSHSELDSCLTYLHAIGELLYFKDICGLAKNVVLNPYWLANILRMVFRHDLKDKLIYRDGYRKLGVVQFQLEQDKEQLFKSGIMKQRMLKCICLDVIKSFDEICLQLSTMLSHFGLACEMPTYACDLDHLDNVPSPDYLMPWFLGSKRPSTIETNWPLHAAENQVEVTAGFEILQYLPYGIFERFSVRCHSHDPHDFEHWQNGLYMKYGDVLVLGGVSHHKKCSTLKLAARAPEHKLQVLWKTLLSLLKEVQKLLQEWPGMNFVPFTLCPVCVKLSNESPFRFTYNWFQAHKLKRKNAQCRNRVGGVHNVDLDHLFPSDGILMELQNADSTVTILPEDEDFPEEIFDEVAKMLGAKWPQLARKLSIGGNVDTIKNDNKDNTHEQAVEMFKQWRMENGKSATRGKVCKALRELDCKSIAEFIEKKLT